MIKVLLVKSQTSELEKLINNGWAITHALVHPQGSLLIITRVDRPATLYQPKKRNLR